MLGLRPIGAAPISALLIWTGAQTSTMTVRFASQSFVTRANDSPGHEFIDGRIRRGLQIDRGIRQGSDGQFGSLIETRFGEIELDNIDGQLDSLVTGFYADGREVRVKLGHGQTTASGFEDVMPFATFSLAYKAVAGDWYFEYDVIRLRLIDSQELLKDRLQLQTYAGTGGAQGTAEIAGRSRPLAFGECLNVEPQLVDPASLIVQFHSGSMEEISQLRDSGVPLDFEADFPNFAALVAGGTSAGSYSTCLAEGYAALGIAPSGRITADIKGDNADGYIDTHGAVLKRILLSYSTMDQDEIDIDSFDALDVTQPATMGLFLPAGDASTIEEVIASIADSCGAVAGGDGSGLYRVFRLEEPGTATWRFGGRDIISIDRERLPYLVPWRSWQLGYARNFTVQSGSDLAIGVNQTQRQLYESEYRYAHSQNANIAIAHRTSKGITANTLFLDEAVAETEADRRMSLYGLGRSLYRVVVKDERALYDVLLDEVLQHSLFGVRIGQTVRLSYSKWDLAGGKRCVVVGVQDDADTLQTTLLLFG